MNKELERLETLLKRFGKGELDSDEIAEMVKLESEIEKEHKALEIIRKKVVLVDVFIESESANDYNEFVSKSKERHLTEEEYELLKEVLC